MKAIVTVVGKDKVGIIAFVCARLAQHNVNVLDISQTVMQGYFNMIMLTDISGADLPLGELSATMKQAGEEMGVVIRMQREDIFSAMHRV